jgi:hypothetical protein
MGSTWNYLDITALRQEKWEDSPEGYPQTPPYEWQRRHDEYDDSAESGAATPSAMAGQIERYQSQRGPKASSSVIVAMAAHPKGRGQPARR